MATLLFSRRIREHRSTVVLAVLVSLSLFSMAAGTRGALIQHGLRTVVSVTSYPFLKAMHGTSDVFHYGSGLIFSYEAAKQEAAKAREALVEMTARTAERDELFEENERLRAMMQFERAHPTITVEPARVIQTYRGVLMIDRGSLNGLAEAMCAVTQDGIVGVITQVDPLNATVVTLHNAGCKVGAMIKRNRVRGVVHGSDSDLSRHCTMNYIDMKDDIRPGDLVVTSPESIFPAGYPIGQIASVHDQGMLWKTADVLPSTDPYRTDEVFVVRRAVAPAEALSGVPSQDAASGIPPTPPPAPPAPEKTAGPATKPNTPAPDEGPDDRSLQERYAP